MSSKSFAYREGPSTTIPTHFSSEPDIELRSMSEISDNAGQSRSNELDSEGLYWHLYKYSHQSWLEKQIEGDKSEIRAQTVVWNPSDDEGNGGPDFQKMKNSIDDILKVENKLINDYKPTKIAMIDSRDQINRLYPQRASVNDTSENNSMVGDGIRSNIVTYQCEASVKTMDDIIWLKEQFKKDPTNTSNGFLVLGVKNAHSIFSSSEVRGMRYLVNTKSSSPSMARESLTHLASEYMAKKISNEYPTVSQAKELAACHPGCKVAIVEEGTLNEFKALESYCPSHSTGPSAKGKASDKEPERDDWDW
ncbi:uncharacterized protein L201_002227 [Kwoniella dendrophila CBS 6074]|uniref:Uncharacterized protein n=1 Tax=Kwoniella dendrophila CBS 6074 TaxID=1295534 RepID=A0AAX4JR02_9TREE